MTGDPGYSSAIIEVPQAEAAAGTTKVVWSPTHGPLNVVVPPGTVDGAVVWVQTAAGNVAVTVRVSAPFPPPPPFAGVPASGPPMPGYPPPGQPVPGYPPPGQPVPGYPPPGQPVPGYPAPGQPMPGYPVPGQPFGGPQAYAGPPTAAPGHAWRNALIGGTLAVVLVLGCCVGVRVFGGDDDNQAGKRTGGTSTAAPEPTQVNPEQYVQALASADTAIGASFGTLKTADSAAFAKAAPAAATTIRAETEKLRAIEPPSGAETAHEQLTLELGSMGDMIEESAAAKPDCPAASPWNSLLQSGWAEGVREDAKKLAVADPRYKFGEFLPAAPKETNRRLKTGKIIKRSSSGGLGHLKIKNGADDAAISLVPAKGKKPKPLFTVYVRGGDNYTVKGVRDGTYRVYTASGADWNAAKKGFTRDCSFSRIDDTFKYATTSRTYSIWEVTLTPVLGGNAKTSEIDPNSFPN
ncbi:hypothetical protein ACIBSW_30625 [Actinoplanes sp. NPDC049668]|uniref:hypothetical protein n=1 Tax=unclassified Actinoplanes TaxID=2626549 RepID=UPI0033B54FCD